MSSDELDSNPFIVGSEEVARQFLQSVVVLDDLAWTGFNQLQEQDNRIGTLTTPNYGSNPSGETRGDAEQENSSNAEASGKVPHATSSTQVSYGDVPLLAKPLIHGFARLGLICAVLGPSQEELEEEGIANSGIVSAAGRADIVVLDWKIGDSNGGDTLEVLKQILKNDGSHPRLRLFSIYTGEPDLSDITERIKETIREFYESSPLVEHRPFSVSKGPVHVSVIAKEGSKAPETSGVPEAQLANHLVRQFASMTRGILPNVALAGLAALRNDTPRVLAKFDAQLDPAYLGHRMLLLDPQEAQDHLVEALGAELYSILEDRRPGDQGSLEVIEGWLRDKITNNDMALDIPTRISDKTDPVEMRLELLKEGVNGVPSIEPSKNGLNQRGTGIFAVDLDVAKDSDRAFATLFSLKTHYPGTKPALTLGTILRRKKEEGGWEYYLCLQPKCDAVRLDSATGFPLMPLIMRDESGKFTWVIQEPDGEWVHLDVETKPSRLRNASFVPRKKDNSNREILPCECPRGVFFQDIDKVEYQWVAALKDEHALRISNEVSASLSRPGPNYSEWLRRKAGSH